MNNSNVWQEKLIALLYGELSPSEERDVRLRLETDADLRREWEELQEGREWMGALETDVEIPQFVFLHDTKEVHPIQGMHPQAVAAAVKKRSWWNVSSPIWAAAAAVFLVATLALSDFRIERLDGGLAMRFGDRPNQTETLGDPSSPQRGADYASAGDGNVQVTPVSGTVGGQDSQDRRQYSGDEVLYLVGAMIEDRDRRRDQELTALLQAMYKDVGARQDRDYRELKDRIQALNIGFVLDREGLEDRFNNLEGVKSLNIDAGQPVGNDGPKEY